MTVKQLQTFESGFNSLIQSFATVFSSVVKAKNKQLIRSVKSAHFFSIFLPIRHRGINCFSNFRFFNRYLIVSESF